MQPIPRTQECSPLETEVLNMMLYINSSSNKYLLSIHSDSDIYFEKITSKNYVKYNVEHFFASLINIFHI